jgi:hypothetical protein
MAVKIVLKGTAMMGGQNTPDWYRHDTENLAGVTNMPSNEAFGLDGILIFPPSDSQAENGMICAVILKTIVGDIRGTVYQSKNAPGTCYLRPPQSREEIEETGEVKYHDEVKMPSKLIAQVLRYIETQVDIIEEKPEELEGVQAGLNGVRGTLTTADNPFNVPAGNVDQHANPLSQAIGNEKDAILANKEEANPFEPKA